ncbi:hypothetical protein ACSNOD_31695, partial [Streptomyces sp. URMC 123]
REAVAPPGAGDLAATVGCFGRDLTVRLPARPAGDDPEALLKHLKEALRARPGAAGTPEAAGGLLEPAARFTLLGDRDRDRDRDPHTAAYEAPVAGADPTDWAPAAPEEQPDPVPAPLHLPLDLLVRRRAGGSGARLTLAWRTARPAPPGTDRLADHWTRALRELADRLDHEDAGGHTP